MKKISLLDKKISRRSTLGGLAATTALATMPIRAFAQDTTVRWWSPQSAPAQVAAYKSQISAFEAANPGVKVVFETTSDEGYAPQLAASCETRPTLLSAIFFSYLLDHPTADAAE